MRLYLINPSNPLVTIVTKKKSFWNLFRVWKPLSLMTIAGLTPTDWDVSIFDENLSVPDYKTLPRPDLVGITAFTSQANRAYEISAYFRQHGVPVVMGGIHATMCKDEAITRVDSVVAGEAESVWTQLLDDFKNNELKQVYKGEHTDLKGVPSSRHDILPIKYIFGAIQTTRGCPLDCNFCSVSAFNGRKYRQRPIPDIIEEFRLIPEKRVLIVDDNLIGTRTEHIERSKELFRAMIKAKLKKNWIGQVTINFGDDEELLKLASKSGCKGVFIGFETPTKEGLLELRKKINLTKGRDIRKSVRQIQKYGILVMGSFMMGLDIDVSGIGKRIADIAIQYQMDYINVLFLTPFPGTNLWDKMKSEGRIFLNRFPDDWKYYTLTIPAAKYKQLSFDDIISEMESCYLRYYSFFRILHRVWDNLLHCRQPLVAFFGNLATKSNLHANDKIYEEIKVLIEKQ
ncbi:MAG TPA: radical SAM protein [Victivallales bacterium]|nr:radical SAM protein [Victivallales bacterium]